MISLARPASVSLAIALALTTLAPAAQAQSAEAFPSVHASFVRGAFIDGDLLAVGGGGVALQWRGGARFNAELRGVRALCGARVGDRLVVVAVDDREMVLSDGATSRRASVPTLEGERVVGCAVDANGRVFFAGESRAIYRLHDGQWRLLTTPSGASIRSIATGPAGVFVASERGFWRVEEERVEPLTVTGLEGREGEPASAWVSPRTGRLYLAWGDALVSVDVARGTATSHRHGMFGRAQSLTGVASNEGDLLAIGAQSEVALFDGRTFTVVARDGVTFNRALAFDLAGRALYVGAQQGVTAVAIAHPWLASAASALPPPVPQPVHTTQPANAVTAPSRTPLAQPRPAAPTLPRARRFQFFPTARAGFGVAMGPLASGSIDTAFALDVRAGAIGYRDESRDWQIWPELGVAYQTGPSPGGTYFTAGLTALYGSLLFSGGLGAHALVGDARTGLGAGVRSSLVLQGLFTALTVDLSHQFIRVGPEDRHEFRATLAINPIPIIAGFFLMSGFFRVIGS
jgi:hypothetical protein